MLLKKAWLSPEWRNAVDKLILAVVRQAWNDLQDMEAGYEPGRPKACFERESFELCFEIFLPLLNVKGYTASKMKSRVFPKLKKIYGS
jgi:hypothetical protein